jgi:hypothetical protein
MADGEGQQAETSQASVLLTILWLMGVVEKGQSLALLSNETIQLRTGGTHVKLKLIACGYRVSCSSTEHSY